MAVFSLAASLNYRKIERDLQQVKIDSKAPTVYTFADPYTKDELLRVWATSWSSSGYTARILTPEHAESHPKYEEYSARLEEAKVRGRHKRNFLRFVAVSAMEGGGFYSEPFVLPLKNAPKDLPDGGRFIMHGGVLADVMSGSEDEWNRVTRLLMDNIAGRNSVLAFFRLHRTRPDAFVWRNSTYSAEVPANTNEFLPDCNAVRSKIAVRFRVQHMIQNAFFSDEKLEFMQTFRQRYMVRCDMEPQRNRPTIHTFYAPVRNLSTERNDELVEMWKDRWYRAGWDPVVLSPEDAQRHPYYDDFIPIFRDGQLKDDSYNQICYLRWLAMAASGGGWMTDIDTFPLNIMPETTLPNQGKFTGYNWHVPSLLSGSALEWNRMTLLLMESYRNNGHNFWTDMFAMKELRENGEYIVEQRVTMLKDIYSHDKFQHKNAWIHKFTQEVCRKTQDKMANHFSHHDIEFLGYTKEERIQVISLWTDLWEKKCKSSL